MSSRELQVEHEQGYSGFVLQYGWLFTLSDHPVPLLGMWAALKRSILFLGPHLSRGNGVLPSFSGSVSGDRISNEEKYDFLIHPYIPLSLWFASDANLAKKYFSIGAEKGDVSCCTCVIVQCVCEAAVLTIRRS